MGDWLETVLSGEFIRAEKAMLGYRSMFVGSAGSKVLFDNATDRYAGDVHAILPGKACRSLNETAVRGVFEFIDATAGRCSRVDVAADDFAKRVTPTEFREHRNGPTVVTMTRPGRFHIDDSTGGSSFYVGARTSRAMARVYDKAAESGGNIDAIRFELEFKAEAAAQLQRELMDRHWGDVWVSHMVKLIDFRERWADSNVTRCPRVTWWDELVGDARRAGPYLVVKPKTVEESMKWLKRQWVASRQVV